MAVLALGNPISYDIKMWRCCIKTGYDNSELSSFKNLSKLLKYLVHVNVNVNVRVDFR